MKKLMANQRGGVMILMVLAFMAFGSPVIIGTLRLSDSLATDSGVKTRLLRRDYCGLAISEYVRYLTLTQARWDAWWDANRTTPQGDVPALGQEVLTFGKCNATFNLQTSGAPGDPPAIPPSQLTTTKSVDLNSVSPGAVLEYRIVLSNPSASLLPVDLTAIYDGLPLGFSYQTSTTLLVWPGGQLTDDPIQTFPGADDDQYCLFVENDSLTVTQDYPCSVGATDNVTVEQNLTISGSVRGVLGNVELKQGVRVEGDIRAGGNVILGQNVYVGGTIRADGNVTIGQGTTVQGNILAGTGNVNVDQTMTLGGDIVSLNGGVTIDQGANFAGDIWAKNSIEASQNAVLGGSAWAKTGKVKLDAGATLAGAVVAGGLYEGDPAQVLSGQITTECIEPACPFPPVPAWALTDGSGDRLLLTWDLATSGVTLNPGEDAVLTFNVLASSEVGNYCNQAWADPGGTGVGSGVTAKAAVGGPSGTLCEGEEIVLITVVDKKAAATGSQPTFTFTTTIQNTGLTNLTLTTVRSKLPPGFSYVAGSAKYLLLPSQTEVAAAEPTKLVTAGRQRLTWFPQPFDTATVGAGVTRTLTFKAIPDAALVKGNYRSESWSFFQEYDSDQTPYTWPTALIQVLDPFEGTAIDSDGKDLGSYEAWQGTPTTFFNWTIR